MRRLRFGMAGMTAVVVSVSLHAQTATLTPQDYIAIQQLVSKYAYAIDECTNRGYDYADLYVAGRHVLDLAQRQGSQHVRRPRSSR